MALSPDPGAALPPLRARLALRPDGTLVADYAADGPAADPVGAPETGVGEWAAEGDRYALIVVALRRDANGRFAGRVALRESGRLDAATGDLLGAFAFDAADAGGATVAVGGGTTRGQRS